VGEGCTKHGAELGSAADQWLAQRIAATEEHLYVKFEMLSHIGIRDLRMSQKA